MPSWTMSESYSRVDPFSGEEEDRKDFPVESTMMDTQLDQHICDMSAVPRKG
jgi:hypothetical protein